MNTKTITLILLVIVTMFTVSCDTTVASSDADAKHFGVTPSTNGVTPTDVDTSKILTFRDYDELAQKLFKEYDQFDKAQFKEYRRKDAEMFSVYQAARDSAIREIRAKDPVAYHEWLDAREMNDYTRHFKIERENPSFESYRRTNVEYRSLTKNTIALYKQYEAAKDSVYREYNRKRSLAYQAYVAHGSKR